MLLGGRWERHRERSGAAKPRAAIAAAAATKGQTHRMPVAPAQQRPEREAAGHNRRVDAHDGAAGALVGDQGHPGLANQPVQATPEPMRKRKANQAAKFGSSGINRTARR